jgi:hypothetical protein
MPFPHQTSKAILFLSIILSFGCQRSKVVELPTKDSTLILNGINEFGKSWNFSLERVLNIGQASGARLEEGKVWLTNTNGEIVYLTQDSLIRNKFSSPNFFPEAGQDYIVQAFHPGFDSVYAYIHVPPPMPEIKLYFQLSQNEVLNSSTPIWLELNDPEPENRNFFMLYAYLKDSIYNEIKANALFSEDPIFNFSLPLKLPVTDRTVLLFPSFFTDDLFVDGKYNVNLRFWLPDFEFVEGRRLEVSVATLSEEMYDYLKAYQKQGNLKESPFAEHSPVYGNVINGDGLVAVYTPVSDSLQI